MVFLHQMRLIGRGWPGLAQVDSESSDSQDSIKFKLTSQPKAVLNWNKVTISTGVDDRLPRY